jgi:hypothetical protein
VTIKRESQEKVERESSESQEKVKRRSFDRTRGGSIGAAVGAVHVPEEP